MNQPEMATNFGLKITGDSFSFGQGSNQIPFTSYRSDHETRNPNDNRLADKFVTASYLNVAFLNDHLHKYSRELSLPSLGQNVLYLAYTIEVKPEARFNADHLRSFLEANRVETKSEFKFHSTPLAIQNRRVNLKQSQSEQRWNNDKNICIGCQQDKTIADLIRIINVFDRFFEQFRTDGAFHA